MDRRQLLEAIGVVGSAGVLGAVLGTALEDRYGDGDEPFRTPSPRPGRIDSPTADGTETDVVTATATETETPAVPHADGFETVIKAADRGVVSEGAEPVNDLFEEHAGDGTLLAFEAGTYPIDYFALNGLSRFGVVGTGDEPARFVPAEGRCRGGRPWVSLDRVADLVLENVVFDFRGSDSGGPLHLLLRGDSIVRDVTVLGSCSNQIGVCKVEVQDEDGTAVFDRVEARNVGANQSLTGIYVRRGHAGEVTFRECSLETFSDNGLYASAPGLPDGDDGDVRVLGGTYRNNDIANVRLGTTGARVSDVTVVVDAETPGWGSSNARGIRLRNRSGQVIEGCDITFGPNASDSFGGIVFHAANGGAQIRDTSITVDRASIPAIRAFPVAESGNGAPTFEDCTIGGSASGGVTARIEGRDGTVFDSCTISGTGAGRRGLRFVDSTDCLITGSRIDVSAEPVAVTDGTVTLEDTTIVAPDGERVIEDRVIEDETLSARGTSS
jgi:hypothetical protein